MDQLKELYAKLGTYSDFPSKGVTFKDIFPILEDEEATFLLVEEIVKTIPEQITCIVAPEARGFILGALVAYNAQLKFVPLRKPGKLPGEVISTTYKTEYSEDTLEIRKDIVAGDACWFIDDILATGGTYHAATKLVEDCGGDLLGGTVLLKVLNDSLITVNELFKDVK